MAMDMVQPQLEQHRRPRVQLEFKEQRQELWVLQYINGQAKEFRIPQDIAGQVNLEDQRLLHSMPKQHKVFLEHKRLNIHGRLMDVPTLG